MGKINNKSGVEIIPIGQGSSGNNKSQTLENYKMQRQPYLADPSLVPRVQKYLESNVDKTYVDINVMADELQRTYREYGKRKRSAFRASVKKAYGIVLKSYGLEDAASSEEEEEVSDDSEGEGNNQFDNSMNNQIMDLYKRPSASKMDENELIDISSDDSDDVPSYTNNKASNGPSTSAPCQPTPSYPSNSISSQQKRAYDAEYNNNNERSKKRKLGDGASPSKLMPKRKKSAVASLESTVTFKNVGGLNKTLEEVCKLLLHIKHPELYRTIGITPPRGFLLHGPPGCGKTLLANAIAGELEVPLLKVAAPELVAGVSGESEERIRELFEKAVASAPCVLFIDEIDAITPNRQNAQKEMERRIVAQLLSCLDDLNASECCDKILVIGATNRPDSIDPALRRSGRFDREICLGIPDVHARAHILKVMTSHLKLSDSFDFESLAKYTPGYVGADLLALTREAAMVAVNRKFYDIKEARKLEEAINLQKELEKKKLEAEAAAAEAAAAVASITDSKNDPEIIVDDESKDATPIVAADAAQNDNNPVVVIDDEPKASSEAVSSVITASSAENTVADSSVATPTELPLTVVSNGESKISITEDELLETEQMPIDTNTDANPDSAVAEGVENVTILGNTTVNKSPLEELIHWLHDKKPINPNQLESICITMEDFAAALKAVQPSAKREGFVTVPDTTWDDVGSLRDIREELQMAILAPVRHSEQFKALGINVPTGVLLCGPPGCGKTLLAKAIANEAGINFISVKGPELLNMYVGESERAVRVCFERARNSAPCVIFFDELDALCPKRSDTREGSATMRVVNQLLTEMDGIEGRQGVFLLAASNRPDIIDSAVLRPGRLDKILFVGLPSATDRVDVLRAITKNGTCPRLAPDVDLEVIGSSDEVQGYTGADLAALVREASVTALKEFMLRGVDAQQQPLMVTTDHFKQAVGKIRPSVSEKDQKHYEKLRRTYTAVPEQIGRAHV